MSQKLGKQDFVEEKLYGARPEMLITRYVTVLNNYPVEKALSNVKCEPGISSCGQLGRACRIEMQLEVICVVERGQKFFRIAAGGGERAACMRAACMNGAQK